MSSSRVLGSYSGAQFSKEKCKGSSKESPFQAPTAERHPHRPLNPDEQLKVTRLEVRGSNGGCGSRRSSCSGIVGCSRLVP